MQLVGEWNWFCSTRSIFGAAAFFDLTVFDRASAAGGVPRLGSHFFNARAHSDYGGHLFL